MRKYYQKIVALLKQVDYKELAKFIAIIINSLPGFIAWAVELVAMASAAIFVFSAAQYAYEDGFYQALILVALSGMMVGLSILCDLYTSRGSVQDSTDGGGD